MFEFHRQLLDDEVRTNAFRRAIQQAVTPDDVVLDIGTGTGILAFFACQAGARRVLAVEGQHTADAASLLTRLLGFSDRLTVFHARSHEVELPERATLLITETLGSLGFDEGILGTLADARRRLLVPAARIIPSRIALWAAPVELPEFYEQRIAWWEKPRYGFDFSSVRLFASNDIYSAELGQDALLAPIAPVIDVDAYSVEGTMQEGSVRFRTSRAGVVHGFATGFTARLTDDITVSNAWSGADSWHRGVFPLHEPLTVEAGTMITLRVETDNGRRWRWSGAVEGVRPAAFDQNTILSRPPCTLAKTAL